MAQWEQYYQMQRVCPEGEWNDFISSMKTKLPFMFRISGTKYEAKALNNFIKGPVFHNLVSSRSVPADEEEDKLSLICCNWFPKQLTWQLNAGWEDINQLEKYFSLGYFLKSEIECGKLIEQNTVDTIPLMLLDITSQNKILEMNASSCAVTKHLIDLLHGDEEGTLPSGFLISNVADKNRFQTYVHAKRLGSACTAITNHDPADIPFFGISNRDGSQTLLNYDKVLCQVSCSDDGNVYRNPDIWLNWNTINGNELHSNHFRVLRHGVELMDIGGRLVYTTHSLNPLENEAVVYRFMKHTRGAVKLVDVSSTLSNLKFMSGLSNWLVAVGLHLYDKYDDIPQSEKSKYHPLMFAPCPEDASNFQLDKCIRILPHHQNTGCCFVAVMEKQQRTFWECEKLESSVTEPQKKRIKTVGFRENIFNVFTEDENLREFYSITENLLPTCLVTTCKEGMKDSIYMTTPAITNIVISNSNRMKLIKAGIKTFQKFGESMKCAYSLTQEGLYSIATFMGSKQKISLTKPDLIQLLLNNDWIVRLNITSLDKATQEKLTHVESGSCVLIYEGAVSPSDDSHLKLALVGWKEETSLRTMISFSESVHYLRLCGVYSPRKGSTFTPAFKTVSSALLSNTNKSDENEEIMQGKDNLAISRLKGSTITPAFQTSVFSAEPDVSSALSDTHKSDESEENMQEKDNLEIGRLKGATLTPAFQTADNDGTTIFFAEPGEFSALHTSDETEETRNLCNKDLERLILLRKLELLKIKRDILVMKKKDWQQKSEMKERK